jgi:mono/diheme cytochrome c family protein
MPIRLFCAGLVVAATLHGFSPDGHAKQADKGASLRGDAEKGRALFNGKGICHYCHGVDGHLSRRPQLSPETQGVIDRLSSPPADLRRAETLHLRDDTARFHIVRDGHPGSGMFPDTTLTDQDIKDVLAYLATLRKNASPPGQNPY